MKIRDFRFHIYSESLAAFPEIAKGDVIRMHYAVTEIRPKEKLVDFRIFRETNLIVFPLNDREKPRCSTTCFTFTEDDIAQVKQLKAWSLNRHVPILMTDSKITTLSVSFPSLVDIIELILNLHI